MNYILTTTKLDAIGHRWIAKLATLHFTLYYHLGKSNVEADVFSRIPWDQIIRAEMVEAIFKATVEGPNTLMEIYACHEKAISYLNLKPPPQMTIVDWVQAQKVDPTIDQVVTWRKARGWIQ